MSEVVKDEKKEGTSNPEVKQVTLESLESTAYRTICEIEQLNRKLTQISQLIRSFPKAPVAPLSNNDDKKVGN